MKVSTLTTFSATDAQGRFGELLELASGQPVGITKDDQLTAYVISKPVYEAMVEKLEQLEDQLWLLRVDAARKEGFVDSETVDALLSKLRNNDDEEVKNREGSNNMLG